MDGARAAPAVPARAKQGAEAERREMVVGGSRGVDGAHGVGAGERRQRRTLVQSDGQGVRAGDAARRPGRRSGPTAVRRAWMGKASSGSRRRRSSIWLSWRRRCGRASTGRSRSDGWRSRRAMAGRDRWAYRTVKDRIVQTAVKLVIEPIFEATFRPTSYGFRPGRGCQDALREVDQLIEEGYTFVVDADLESYFDTHPARAADAAGGGAHQRWPRARPAARLARAGHPAGPGTMDADAGTPQGAVISPLLANIYLHPLDELMATRGYRMVRYADDFVVLCESREEAEAALAEIRALGGGERPDVCIRTKRMSATAGSRGRVRVPRLPVRSRPALGPQEEPRQLKDSIRAKTRRTRGDSLARIVIAI